MRPPPSPDLILPPHGGYRRLKSFQVARLIYDITVRFCQRYIPVGSRTDDQMVQAARSGAQNIAEGSMASATSSKMEMKLTNVARASLEELRRDYEDYLRQHSLPLWNPRDPRLTQLIALRPTTADHVAQWAKSIKHGHQSIPSIMSISYPEIAANGALALITVASSLLRRQLAAQARAFLRTGGFTERLHRTRLAARRSKEPRS
ncbi:MAG TPA: four helix bundle suffix domain-containing protein [Planctomycetota bacterium]|nr:four helix bundle suffix domain-containing protein [Planctomycetota bacterium]HRR79428.1 four helix bundle suffix domain-containing protein [Planctomycetota bacterium]HRT95474.1 four helix bundle suffix domain-containing protein [Planctomycetota bacterium]